MRGRSDTAQKLVSEVAGRRQFVHTGLKHTVGPYENHYPPFKPKFMGMGHISYEIIVLC